MVWQKVYGTDDVSSGARGMAQIAEEGYFIADLVSQESPFRIFQIDKRGNLVGGLEELNIASIDITPQITTTKPVESSFKPEPVQVDILDLDLNVTKTETSNIFLTEK